MLKLKLQYFGHLMWRTDSFEKTPIWERLKTGGEGDDRGWDGWMASPSQWTWVWVDSGCWWWTGRPGVLQCMGSQRVGHDWASELNWTEEQFKYYHSYYYCDLLETIQSITSWRAAAAKSLKSCPTLCDPIDGSPLGSPVPGILQARTLEWVAFPSPMHESEKWKWSHSVVSDSSPPHGLQPTGLLRPWTSQARVLEWGAIAYSSWRAEPTKHFLILLLV